MPPGEEHPDGEAALELVDAAGVHLDPWQKRTFKRSLLVRDGKFAAFEVGLICPRQNGKNEIVLARQLAGLFIFREELIIHSAHEFATSLEAFRRLTAVILDNDWLLDEVLNRERGIKRSHGEEGVELRTGQRIRFRTRTGTGARGFTGDCLIFDEAMELPAEMHSTLLPTLSARPNPQVWCTSSAVDQQAHSDGLVLSRIRERGISGGDDGLAYFEWSAPGDINDLANVPMDREAWAQANPALGIRIREEHVALEQRAMDPRGFAVERLGIGDWPDPSGAAEMVIPFDVWDALADSRSGIEGAVDLAVDVSPDRSFAAIAASGIRPDGKYHFEVVERDRGTGWVVARVFDLTRKHNTANVIIDGAGPGAALIPELEKAGVKVTPVTAQENARACGILFDAAVEDKLRHLGTQELNAAIRGASKRSLGDAWALSRKNSAVDISPLVACTLALWGTVTRLENRVPMIAWA